MLFVQVSAKQLCTNWTNHSSSHRRGEGFRDSLHWNHRWRIRKNQRLVDLHHIWYINILYFTYLYNNDIIFICIYADLYQLFKSFIAFSSLFTQWLSSECGKCHCKAGWISTQVERSSIRSVPPDVQINNGKIHGNMTPWNMTLESKDWGMSNHHLKFSVGHCVNFTVM